MKKNLFFLLIIFNIVFSQILWANSQYIEYKPVEDMKFLKNSEMVKSFSYTNMFIYDNNYLMVDRRHNFFDIYDKNGKFIGHIRFNCDNLSHKLTNFVFDENSNFLIFDNKSSKFYTFTDDGELLHQKKIETPVEKINRINEIDAKVYYLKKSKVYLDFIKKSITIEKSGSIQKLKYAKLNPDCYIMQCGNKFYMKDPAIAKLIDINKAKTLYTGEIILEDSQKRIYLLDKENEKISIYYNNELISYYEPSDNHGPFCGDLAIFKNDDLAILDSQDCRIYIYNKEGMKLKVFGIRGDKKGELKEPVSIVIDEADRIIVRDIYKEKAILFDKKGNFIMEMKDLSQNNLPKEFRIYLDLDNQIHLVDFYRKLHFAIPFHFSYLKELDEIFDLVARYPREYMTITDDGNLLYFDSNKNVYNILKRDGTVHRLDIGKKISNFSKKSRISFKSIIKSGEILFMISKDDKLYIYNKNKMKYFPFKQKIVKISVDDSQKLAIITKNKRLFKIDMNGDIYYNRSISKLDYNILLTINALYVFRLNEVKILDNNGKYCNTLKLDRNYKIIKIVEDDDKIYLFYEKNGFIGLFKYKRKNLYMEASRYFNNGLFKMSAVRLEKLLENGIDNVEVNYKLYICYKKLNKFELADKIYRHIKIKWPKSKEATKL